jgi:hypothetical protein|tara:strand:+ start:89 stop:1054 length:966 start_codon:yes stop_codon:yes gene_type:complete
MALSSRQGLIDYCLRRLGFPVIEINIDEDQIEDRVDDALQLFQEYHFDGVERTYVKHQITGSTLNISTSIASNFSKGETLTGATSGATAILVSGTGTAFTIDNILGTFTAGEVINGSVSGLSATLSSSNHYSAGDMEKGYIPIGTEILSIQRLFPVGQNDATTGTNNMFDLMYQFRMNDMYSLLSADLTYYTMVQSHLTTLDQMFVNQRQIRWNRKTNRLYIDTDWDMTFNVGDYVIAEAYAILNPETYNEVYDDMFLKKYLTALLKRQWGENMKKFGGIQLPGGVTLNGVELFQEATAEIAQIEDEMQMKYELPPSFMVG